MTEDISIRADLARTQALVIEDNPVNAQLVSVYLRAMGIGTVRIASDGEQGLALAAEAPPDLVVLDLMMPGLDGFEVCQRLRARNDAENLPILVQTALDSAADRNRVFDIGANDLVVKPIDRQEFTARARLLLDNRALLRTLRETQARRDQELALAAEAQQALLPTSKTLEALRRRTGIRIEGLFRPSSELGGDLWGVGDLGDGRFTVTMADFTGHGVAAALNVFRLHTLLNGLPILDAPSATLETLNATLCRLLPTGHFATAFHGVVDPARGEVSYTAAATPSPIAEGVLADGTGLPLGISPQASYPARRLRLRRGVPILLYSDALVETPTETGHPLGEESVLHRLREAPEANLEDLLHPLLSRLPPQLPDDLTVIRLSVD